MIRVSTGLLAPPVLADTSPEIVQRLNAEVLRIPRLAQVQTRLPVEGAGRLTRRNNLTF